MEQLQNHKNFELYLKCLQGRASDEEYQRCWENINVEPAELTYYNELKKMWISTSVTQTSEGRLKASWKRIKGQTLDLQNINKQFYFLKSESKLGLFFKVAATILLFIGLTFLSKTIISHIDKKDLGMITVEAPKGAKTYLTLNDGTKIWLNAGSKVQYFKSYNQENRIVQLEGEAFFKVSKNKKLPFRVFAQGVEVKAVGTSFNVNAYPDDGYVQTTLVEGSVVITPDKNLQHENTITLQPNQSVTVYSQKQKIIKQPLKDSILERPKMAIQRVEIKRKVTINTYISWKDKRWVFDGESIADLAIKLERRFDVKIIILDDELNNCKISGILEDENIEQILTAIRLTVPMDFKILNDTVHLSLNKNLKKKYFGFVNRN